MHVMVVEDHVHVAEVCMEFLRGKASKITVRTHGFTELVRDMHAFDGVDALVADYQLGEQVTGCDIAQVAKKSGVEKVVLITATRLDVDACRGIPVIHKPFDGRELRLALGL